MTDTLPKLPARERSTHKGDYGHAVVVAGSTGFTGAAALTSEGALRSGAGLVTLTCPAGVWAVLASKLTEVMVRSVGPEGAREWSVAAASAVEDFIGRLLARGPKGRVVLAIGPGMGREKEPALCARRLAGSLEVPLVLDADGAVAFAGCVTKLAERRAPTVLTPHPGEAARLVGEFDGRDDLARREAALRLSREARAVVLLKGHRTLVTDGEKVEVNETGNPGMASGGVGDVLTGVVAGLLAAGLKAFDAARLGAYVHGLAGDMAAEEVGETSLTAGDVLRSLPAAIMKQQG
jgi:NAD(P)H-hydrate epimerase